MTRKSKYRNQLRVGGIVEGDDGALAVALGLRDIELGAAMLKRRRPVGYGLTR